MNEGVFNDKPYHNRLLYVQHLNPAEGLTGVSVESIKLKPTRNGDATDMTGFNVGDVIDVYYDRYRNVDTVALVPDGF